MTNARWLSITEQDRQELADLFRGWLAAIHAFVDQINERPLVDERQNRAAAQQLAGTSDYKLRQIRP